MVSRPPSGSSVLWRWILKATLGYIEHTGKDFSLEFCPWNTTYSVRWEWGSFGTLISWDCYWSPQQTLQSRQEGGRGSINVNAVAGDTDGDAEAHCGAWCFILANWPSRPNPKPFSIIRKVSASALVVCVCVRFLISSPQLFLAPGTSFTEDNFSMGWFWDDSSALHLSHTSCLI